MKKKRIASAVLAAVLFLTALCGVLPASAAALPFRDVPENEWFYEPVKAVYEAGIMKSTSATTFGPQSPMTRGQIVTILSRMSGDEVAGMASEMNFRDVNRAEYYADPIGWAVKNGIAKGMSETTFEPETPVLRQEFAAFFVRYMRYKGIVFLGEEVEPFPDEFPDWAADDIETLQVLNAMFLMYDIDLYVSDERYFEYFADSDAFADLSLLIDADLLSAIPDTERYYYTDSNGVRTLKGICLKEGSALHEAGYYHNEVIIGAVGSGDNLDKAIAVISQLLSNRK